MDDVCSAQKDSFDPEVCKSLLGPDTLMVTYWTKTWGNWMMEGKMETMP
jgi:hypothetical protein